MEKKKGTDTRTIVFWLKYPHPFTSGEIASPLKTQIQLGYHFSNDALDLEETAQPELN